MGTHVCVYMFGQCKTNGSLSILIVPVMVYIYRIDWVGVGAFRDVVDAVIIALLLI